MLSFQSQLTFIHFFCSCNITEKQHLLCNASAYVQKHLHVLVGIHCILCLHHAWPVYMLSSSANPIKYKMQAFACVCNLLQQPQLKLDHIFLSGMANRETVALEFKTLGRLHKHTKTLQQRRENCMVHQIRHHVVLIHHMPIGLNNLAA